MMRDYHKRSFAFTATYAGEQTTEPALRGLMQTR
jgi:hypothetical protein